MKIKHLTNFDHMIEIDDIIVQKSEWNHVNETHHVDLTMWMKFIMWDEN
jgi:hypothetical protein